MKMLKTSLLCSALLMLPLSLLASDDWIEASNSITEDVMQAQAKLSPETFSSLGIDAVDADILDLSAGIFERQQETLQEIISGLEARRTTVEDPRVLQDVEILLGALRDQLHSARLNQKYLLPYRNVPQSLYFGFRSLLDPRNDPNRYPAALERLKKYTGSAEGYRPITELARERSEERFGHSGLLGPYIVELEKDLKNVSRFSAGLEQLFFESGLDGWQADLVVLQGQIENYAAWMESEMKPRAREDHKLPAELYADNLKSFGVDMDPQLLIRMAQLGFADIQRQMQAISRQIAADRGWESSDYRDVLKKLGREEIPGDVLDYYRDVLVQIETIIRENALVSLPVRDAAIRMATEAEAAAAPVPFLSPPRLVGNTGQQAEFVLVTNDPNTSDSEEPPDFGSPASTWSLTAHEARPGHEMQFASMIESGVSNARAIYAFNSANVEGWGLYSEAIMQEHFSLEAQLFGLKARLLRATRAFLDPMLNLGLIEREKALSFIIGEVGLSKSLAGQEVDRYTFRAPGQATSYYYGYMNLMALRTEVELRMRDRFNQQAYHDFLLSQGLLPPDILRQAVIENFVKH